MKCTIPYFYFFFLLTLTISCGEEIKAPFPQSGVFEKLPETKESLIILPLSVKAKDLRTMIESKLPKGIIHSEGGRASNTKHYSYKVIRDQPIQFDAVGDELRFKVPIRIDASGSYTACAGFWRDGDCCSTPNPFGDGCATPGIRSTENGNTSVNIDAHLVLKIFINPDYSINVQSKIDATLTNNPHLYIDLIGDLVRINISIKDKIEPKLKDFVRKYDKEIEKKVRELLSTVNLKEEIQKGWTELQKPFEIENSGLILNSSPQKLYFENVHSNSNNINISFGVSSILSISDKQILYDSPPLPNLIVDEKKQGGFSIYLPSSISFRKLTTLINESIEGKEVSHVNHKIKINRVKTSGFQVSENKSAILFEVNFSVTEGIGKNTSGILYLTAIPAYDKQKKLLFIQEFKLTPETNSILVDKGLPWLTNKVFYNDIIESASYNFSDDYDKHVVQLEEFIKEIKVDKLTINGKLDKVDFEGFHIDNDNLTLLLNSEGTLNTKPILLN